jgi:hypothetical protein
MRASEPPIHEADRNNESVSPEPFVDDVLAAKFLSLTPQRIKKMARKGEIPAYPIGLGERKTWRFRLSEIAARLETLNTSSRGRWRT